MIYPSQIIPIFIKSQSPISPLSVKLKKELKEDTSLPYKRKDAPTIFEELNLEKVKNKSN